MPSIGVKFDQFIDGGTPIAGDQAVGLRNGQNYRFDISSENNGTTLSISVHQVAHGFAIGQILRIDNVSGVYMLAQADTIDHSAAVGIVSAVEDVDDFTLQIAGYVINLAPTFVVGRVYFLSPTVPGSMTSNVPTVPGQIRKPVFIAAGTSFGFWLNYQGQQL